MRGKDATLRAIKAGVMLGAATLACITPFVMQAQAGESGESVQPPACTAAGDSKSALTVDDVLHLHGQGLGRANPFGAYDVSHDGKRVAVQIGRRLDDLRAHATFTFFWLHADIGVYDIATSRQVAFLDDAARGDSWASPFWSPSDRYLALTHVGPNSLDRELYTWDVGRSAPKQIVPGALAASLRFAIGDPNGRAGAYAWLDSVTLVTAMLPPGTGTLDQDDAIAEWPKLWNVASSGMRASASITDAHLPSFIQPAHPTLGDSLTLWRINVRTGQRRALLRTHSLRGRTPRDILISRDAQWIAFTPDVRPIDASAASIPPLNRAETELILINLRDGRILHPLPGRHVTLTRWSDDDSTVGARLIGDTVVQVRRDGSVFRPDPPVIEPITRRPPTPRSLANAPDVPHVETRVDDAGEHLLVRRGNTLRTIISLDQDIAKLDVCRPWYVRYTTDTGDTVFARITMPPGYSKGTRYPLIVQMYPGTVHTKAEQRSDTSTYPQPGDNWLPALLAARGYVVLEPSMPLSGGGADRASEFPGDILPAVDSLIKFGIADPDRLGIDGISFGGYGTAMVIEQTHRFKAAVLRNGLYDLISMYGQFNPTRRLADDANEQLWAPGWAEGGQGHLGVPPYGHWDTYLEASPLMHVESISTPVLIIGGDMDYAAPLSQSEELFTALNRLGKPVRFIRYAGEAHGNASPAGIRHMLNEMTDWFDGWLKRGEPSTSPP